MSTLLSQGLIGIFNADQQRPVYGSTTEFQRDPHWQDLILFCEYCHGANGVGNGMSHRTG